MKRIALNLMLVFLVLGLIIATLPNTVKAQETAISVIPANQNVTMGSSVNINITITKVTNLYGFEFKLFWSNTILNVSRIRVSLPWSPNFIAKNETLQNYNSTNGRYWLAASGLGPVTPFTGNTTVLMATFETIKDGTSPLVLFDTKLGDPAPTPIPHVRNSGSVNVSLVRDTAINQINVSPTTVAPGEPVNINVTAANLGAVNETFTVTTFYNTTTISTLPVTNLTAGSNKLLTFVWNTSGVAEGSYTIKANASLAPGDVNATNNVKVFTPNVMIQKTTSTISISTSVTTVKVGANVTISGTITPTRANVDVIIEIRVSGTTTWTTLATVKTNTNSQYSYQWKTSQVNIQELRARWAGDSTTAPATSSTATVTVQKLDSTISLTVSVTTANVGANVTISGTITPTRANAAVTIQIRVSGATTWTNLTTATTDASGKYSYLWKPDKANSYEVRASWQGDATTNSATSTPLATVDVQGGGMDWTPYIIAIVIIVIIVAAIALYFTKIRKAK